MKHDPQLSCVKSDFSIEKCVVMIVKTVISGTDEEKTKERMK